MSTIGVISMKGGVGKTSITANLAAALSGKLGPGRVQVLDLDPQDGLHWHFGLVSQDAPGVCVHSLENKPWNLGMKTSEFGVDCLPYGAADESERKAFERLLDGQPAWIGEQLERAGLGNDSVVLIDTPPGPTVYLKQVFACADLILIVLLADAGSYATIPAMETWLAESAMRHPQPGAVYVLNQVDQTEPLNRDVEDFLQQRLGPSLAPIRVHRDEAVSEALAFQQPVIIYDPHGQASHDLACLASWVIDTLNR